MTTFFVSRHPGALEWAARQQLPADHLVSHLDLAWVQAGDNVIGSLPVHLAAQVCAAGAAYWHLSLEVPSELRGQELSADTLERLGARVERFEVRALHQHTAPATVQTANEANANTAIATPKSPPGTTTVLA